MASFFLAAISACSGEAGRKSAGEALSAREVDLFGLAFFGSQGVPRHNQQANKSKADTTTKEAAQDSLRWYFTTQQPLSGLLADEISAYSMTSNVNLFSPSAVTSAVL